MSNTLRWLRESASERRAHKTRVRHALFVYLAYLADRPVAPFAPILLRLMRAQETSRGSRIRARRLHEQWDRERSGDDE